MALALGDKLDLITVTAPPIVDADLNVFRFDPPFGKGAVNPVGDNARSAKSPSSCFGVMG